MDSEKPVVSQLPFSTLAVPSIPKNLNSVKRCSSRQISIAKCPSLTSNSYPTPKPKTTTPIIRRSISDPPPPPPPTVTAPECYTPLSEPFLRTGRMSKWDRVLSSRYFVVAYLSEMRYIKNQINRPVQVTPFSPAPESNGQARPSLRVTCIPDPGPNKVKSAGSDPLH